MTRPNRTTQVDSGSTLMSQLPTYLLSSLGHGRIGVQCPRKNCRNKFVVNERKWRQGSNYPTRPCPFCFKVSKLPGRKA